MKRIILIIIIILFSTNVKAIVIEDCTTNKMNNLKELANKIELRYTYELKNDDGYIYPVFKVHASNLHDDLKALIIEDFYSMKYQEFKNDGKGNGSINGFKEGETVTVTMKAYTDDECSTRTVSVKQIKMPYYNRFYDEEFCLTNPNFKYCTEFTDVELTDDIYQKEMDKYLEEEKKEEPIINDETTTNYLVIGIISGVVVLIIVLVSYILVRRKRNSL